MAVALHLNDQTPCRLTILITAFCDFSLHLSDPGVASVSSRPFKLTYTSFFVWLVIFSYYNSPKFVTSTLSFSFSMVL